MIQERIFCLWTLATGCNYRCAYCWYDSDWDAIARQRSEQPRTSEWVDFFQRVHRLYGSIFIGVAGHGEPFLHPGFREIVGSLGRIHTLGITTNLSWDPEEWRDVLTPSSVELHASFHPSFASKEPFLEKVRALRKRGIAVGTSLVAYPPYFDRLKELRAELEAAAGCCYLKPYVGLYAGRRYPAAYSEEQKRMLRASGHAVSVPFQMGDTETIGKSCRAGQKAFDVTPLGKIRRCPNMPDHVGEMGDIRDESFRLLEEPQPCPSKRCTCAALAPCLVENDERRLQDHRYTVPSV